MVIIVQEDIQNNSWVNIQYLKSTSYKWTQYLRLIILSSFFRAACSTHEKVIGLGKNSPDLQAGIEFGLWAVCELGPN